MIPKAGILALALLTAAGCSGPPPPATPPPPARAIPLLSAADHAGNAERIAAFVRQQCVERIGSRAAFVEGLRASGWSARETRDSLNARDRDSSGYEFTGGYIHVGWTHDGHGICLLNVDTPLAAPLEPLRDALSRFAGRSAPGPQPGIARWTWNDASGHGFSMQLIAGETLARRQISLSLTLYPDAWSEETLARAREDQSTMPANSSQEVAR